MSRRTLRRLLLILSLAVLIALSGSFLLPRGDARITQANCDKIKEGMAEQEVEAVLGPPGNYTGWPHAVPESSRELVASGLWVGEDGIILVSFDADEKSRFRLLSFGSSLLQRPSRQIHGLVPRLGRPIHALREICGRAGRRL